MNFSKCLKATQSQNVVVQSYLKACFDQLYSQHSILSPSTCLSLIIIFPKINKTKISLLVACFFGVTTTTVCVYGQVNEWMPFLTMQVHGNQRAVVSDSGTV